MSAERTFRLEDMPLFAALTTRELEALRGDTGERAFDRGQLIVVEGEACRGLFIVKTGRVKVYKASEDGREQILEIVKPGGAFNDVPIFDGGPTPASVMAITETTCFIVPPARVTRVLASHPELSLVLLSQFARRVRALGTIVEDLAFNDVPVRLARILLASMEEGTTGPLLDRSMTLQEMAAMVGSVREVVTRSLRKLEKQGLIAMDRHQIVIQDPAGLKRLMGL